MSRNRAIEPGERGALMSRLRARSPELWEKLRISDLLATVDLVSHLEGRDPFQLERWEVESAFSGSINFDLLDDALSALDGRPDRLRAIRREAGFPEEPAPLPSPAKRTHQKAARERLAKIRVKEQARVPTSIARRFPSFARRPPDWWEGELAWEDPYGQIRVSRFWPTAAHFRVIVGLSVVLDLFKHERGWGTYSLHQLAAAFGEAPEEGFSARQSSRRSILQILADLSTGWIEADSRQDEQRGGNLRIPGRPLQSVEIVCDDHQVRPVAEFLRGGHRMARISSAVRVEFAEWFVAAVGGTRGTDFTYVDREALAQIPARAVGLWSFVHSLPVREEKPGKHNRRFYITEKLAPKLGCFEPLSARRRGMTENEIRRIERDKLEDLELLAGLDKSIGLTTSGPSTSHPNGYLYFYVDCPHEERKRLYGARQRGGRRGRCPSRAEQRALLLNDPKRARVIYCRRRLSLRWKRNEFGAVATAPKILTLAKTPRRQRDLEGIVQMTIAGKRMAPKRAGPRAA